MKNNIQPNDFNLLNEGMKLLAGCPVCHKQYNKTSIKIVDEAEDAHLLHACCNKCNSSVLTLIFATGLGITSMGMLTDLNSSDVSKFQHEKVITEDDVLDIYQSLKKKKLQLAI